MSAPRWLCVEGVNGAGKTYLCQQLTRRLTGDRVRFLAELTDTDDPVPREVIAALSRGDSFLRTGHPGTETLALLALKVREYEQLRALTQPPAVVVEDRGPHTVGVYQAAIWAGTDRDDATLIEVADRIIATAGLFRPAPTRVLLLVDDLEACLRRFADRTGTRVTDDERALIGAADRLYRQLAARDPALFRIIDRAGRSEAAVLEELAAEITADAQARP